MKVKEKQKTILITDNKSSITDIICQSLFPDLKIYNSGDEDLEHKIVKEKCDTTILATRNWDISTSVLLMHEKNVMDVIPFEFVDADASKLKPSTLSKLILFELYRLSFQSLKQKVIFFDNTSLFNIFDRFDNESSLKMAIGNNSILFYDLIKSINYDDPNFFILFCQGLNAQTVNPNSTLISDILDFTKQSKSEDKVAKLFVDSMDSFFEVDNSKKSTIKLLDGIIRSLGNKIFQIGSFAYFSNLFFCAFDQDGSFCTTTYIREFLNKDSIISNQIFLQTFSQLFDNDSYMNTLPNFDHTNANKLDKYFMESSNNFLNIYKELPVLKLKQRYQLVKGFNSYFKFLCTQPSEAEKKKFLDTYTERELTLLI